MMEDKPKKVGKIGYYNSLTGYILYNFEMIPFHKKDCININDKDEVINKDVEFDLEITDTGKVARNVELVKVLKIKDNIADKDKN